MKTPEGIASRPVAITFVVPSHRDTCRPETAGGFWPNLHGGGEFVPGIAELVQDYDRARGAWLRGADHHGRVAGERGGSWVQLQVAVQECRVLSDLLASFCMPRRVDRPGRFLVGRSRLSSNRMLHLRPKCPYNCDSGTISRHILH